jgi:hypothetical protein
MAAARSNPRDATERELRLVQLEAGVKSWGWRWLSVILLVGAADFGVRLATGFQMGSVTRAEALLFLAASALLWAWQRRNPAGSRWQLGLQRVIVALLMLGGLRAALWSLGLSVPYANICVFILGVLLIAAAVYRRHRVNAAAHQRMGDS